MIFAVSCKRTIVHYDERHYCKEHEKIVNRDHLDECNLITKFGKPTKFNDIIENKLGVFGAFKNLSGPLTEQILSYFGWMTNQVSELVNQGQWMIVPRLETQEQRPITARIGPPCNSPRERKD